MFIHHINAVITEVYTSRYRYLISLVNDEYIIYRYDVVNDLSWIATVATFEIAFEYIKAYETLFNCRR